jgi:O-antigen/teichoic acid export membrane protein
VSAPTGASPAAPAPGTSGPDQISPGNVGRSFRDLLRGEAANKGARFVAAAILARALTPRGYGAFNVCIAAAGIATASASLGLGEIGGREAAIRPSRSSWLAGRVLTARWITIALLLLAAMAVGAVGWPGELAVIAVTGAVAIGAVSSGDWLARALQRTRGVAGASAIGGLSAAALSLLVLALGGSFLAALAAFAAVEFVTSALCWRAVRHTGAPQLGVDGLGELLRRAWPIAISSIVVYSYYTNLDTIILSAFHGTATGGIYSAAYRVFLVFNVVAIFAAYANFPTLSRASVDTGDTSARRTLHSNIIYLFAFGAVVVGVVVLAGGDMLALMFGPAFRRAGNTFAVLCIGTLWYLVGYPLGYSLIAADRNRRFLAGAAVAGALSVSLDLILIPPYGMIGAAIANAVCFAAGGAVWIVGYGSLDRALGAVVVGTCTCSAAAALAVAEPALQIVLGSGTIVVGIGAVAAHLVRGHHGET